MLRCFYSPGGLHIRTWLWHCTSGWRGAWLTDGTEVALEERLASSAVAGGEGGGEGTGDAAPLHCVW